MNDRYKIIQVIGAEYVMARNEKSILPVKHAALDSMLPKEFLHGEKIDADSSFE